MRRIALLILLWIPIGVLGQNLVPNWSFEDTLQHVNCITGIEIANHWFNPNAATPDLYSYKASCGNSSFNNPSGYQLPRTGKCYAGIYGYLGSSRDYIGIKLDSSLSNGCNYYIEFYISKADNFGIACDKIGAALIADTTGFYLNNAGHLPFSTAIQSPNGILITDTLSWLKISGNYTASGNESYLIIGNFNSNSNTNWDTVNYNGFLNGAYYYIDDVKLMPCGVTGINENDKIENIKIELTGHSIKVYGSFEGNELNFLIQDITGKVILQKIFKLNKSKEFCIKETFASGIYLVTIISNNLKITKKIIQ